MRALLRCLLCGLLAVARLVRPYWHRADEDVAQTTYSQAEAHRKALEARRHALERERELIQRRREGRRLS